MFGYCKPRNTFISRLIDGDAFQFNKDELYVFGQVEDGYYVDLNRVFTEENFNKKFLVVCREASYYECDCTVEIMTYKQIGCKSERYYLAHTDRKKNYFTWLNELFNFKDGLSFQELLDFDKDQYIIDSKASKKLLSEFRKFRDEAILFSKQFEDEKWFITMYETMMAACKFASKDGKMEIST